MSYTAKDFENARFAYRGRDFAYKVYPDMHFCWVDDDDNSFTSEEMSVGDWVPVFEAKKDDKGAVDRITGLELMKFLAGCWAESEETVGNLDLWRDFAPVNKGDVVIEWMDEKEYKVRIAEKSEKVGRESVRVYERAEVSEKKLAVEKLAGMMHNCLDESAGTGSLDFTEMAKYLVENGVKV